MSSSELQPSSDNNKHPGGGDTSEKFYSAHGITPSESSKDIITRLQKLEEQHTELQEKYKELHTTVENISTTTTSRIDSIEEYVDVGYGDLKDELIREIQQRDEAIGTKIDSLTKLMIEQQRIAIQRENREMLRDQTRDEREKKRDKVDLTIQRFIARFMRSKTAARIINEDNTNTSNVATASKSTAKKGGKKGKDKEATVEDNNIPFPFDDDDDDDLFGGDGMNRTHCLVANTDVEVNKKDGKMRAKRGRCGHCRRGKTKFYCSHRNCSFGNKKLFLCVPNKNNPDRNCFEDYHKSPDRFRRSGIHFVATTPTTPAPEDPSIVATTTTPAAKRQKTDDNEKDDEE